ncbi:ACT domain-containing protein [Desulfitobacterium sp.]|uniref:ACT domain-containing protein n=1 Tax=Desulfitobacterium sp. TaxID=49981 RepID=UPI002B1FB07F|nr:ACT domain-containing protein [Desulfitobacterium sp.]MEA4900319.1 ACT domain-containing protein [Desulfitobacterium sp.]
MNNNHNNEKSNRVIVTVIGKDQIGIIAWVTGRLAEYSVNILDISQTILQDFFTMMMVVDMSQSSISLGELSKRLDQEAQKRGLKVSAQHEDVFTFMHRI